MKAGKRELDANLRQYQEKNEFFENHRKKIMNEARQEAKALLNEANQKIEQTIREIKEKKADRKHTKELRSDLDQFQKSLKPEVVKEPEREIETEPGEIQAGDAVKIVGQDTFGEVITIKDKEAEILIGELKSKVKLNRLQKVSRKEYRKHLGVENKSSVRLNLGEKLSAFSPNLDIRGLRAEEALPQVDSLLDSALIFGVNEIKIIHGKGNGILRTVIRDYLKNNRHIRSMKDEHADRGGAGVTVVEVG
jgi:DNA mismatch repair protein MutS2